MFASTFNLQGGIELGGIYVKTMAPEGPAALSGKINIGALRNQYLFFFKKLKPNLNIQTDSIPAKLFV